ncbi:helix-turn-helix domain-containing protein [Actinomadura sp. LOL_016]|uniref:helix-turn-helix domain-containing protein n=1 Tax=unclassified Actinomadura TaxID=2626254 RepID=UPI003A800310
MVQRLLTIDPRRLQALRVQAGLNACQLAEMVGTTTRMVGYWEEGRHVPEAKNVEGLARALGCSVAALTGRQPGTESLADLRFAAGLSTEKAAADLRGEALGRELFVSATKLRDLERGRMVRGWKWRDPQYTGALVRRLATLYDVPVRMVLDAWVRSRPRDQIPAMPKPGGKPPSAAAVERWESLNGRQRVYLGEIMRDDRMTEVEIWMRRARHLPVPPAAQWRKLPFALRAPADLVGYTRLQERLRARGVHDPGAGSTLHSLARHALLTVSEDQVDIPGVGAVSRVLVELTRAGRAAARAGLEEPREPGPPEHLLSEWLWRTVVRIIEAGPGGLAENSLAGKAPFYLAVGYKPAPRAHASRGFIESRPVMAPDGTHVREYRWHLTELGKRHVLEYSHQYPDPLSKYG